MRFSPILLAFLLLSIKVNGQISLSVKVSRDSALNYSIGYCSIAITKAKDELVINNTVTNKDGYAIIEIKEKGDYTIKASRVGFSSQQSKFTIIETSKTTINFTFILNPVSNTLEEVVINSKIPPVIVKGDTIIYNTSHFTLPSDENLEDILKHIPDIKILENGDIKVRGKLVTKVIINGKEVTNLGAAILTKSITPEMLKNIEVRLKEKKTEFKETLLSKNDVVILDIKLKDKLNLPFFGKSKLFSGYQNKTLIGSYANFFSLNKKSNFHLLAEYDQFGTRTISLGQLKNIDKEAYESVFELPASFSGMKEKEEFNKEIYGFKDFSIFQPALIAFTNKNEINKSISLTIGSYNSINKELINSINTQTFFNSTNPISYFEGIENKGVISKNKIELIYSPSVKRKIEYSLLYSKKIQKSNQDNNNNFSNKFYLFNTKKNNNQLTNNFRIEQILNKKISLSLSCQYDISDIVNTVSLKHNDSNYKAVLIDNNNGMVANFEQLKNFRINSLLSKIFLQYSINQSHQLNYGLKYTNTTLSITKSAFSIRNQNYDYLQNSQFTVNLNTSISNSLSPYVDYLFYKGKFSINSSISLSNIKSIAYNKIEFRNNLLDYKINFTFRQNEYETLSILWRQNVSPINLEKQSEGFELLNFQTIVVPNIKTLTPQYEHVAQLTYNSSILAAIGVTTDIAAIYGDTKNTDKFDVIKNTFISAEYNLLKANYYIISSTFNKSFEKLPLSSKIEINFFTTNQQNTILNNIIYNTRMNMQTYDFSIFTIFDKKVDFKFNTQYQIFNFISELSPTTNKQINFSNEFITNYSFLNKKGLIRFKLKRTEFIGRTKSNFTNLFFKVQYKSKKLIFFGEMDNLLNNQEFYKRDIFPTYQFDNTILTFNRYFKLGLEFKIL